jgi:hypothetical protein
MDTLTPQERAYIQLLRLLAPETLTTEEVQYLAWARLKVMA